ncbi:hypothetical protein ASPTUDRAFT_62662 [Aspergillus tubingensis CBS 134.48]|uniref:Uncharacterized protein n=1 Tax=Aspergillus tubingensis (strain CBS 134.48) TaxID=767770 RepID=A0A1L9NN95_ASPTC|nr:hypothetical protein ASPTUDRAFT_62662 [Aspergillus tubingensis CBS 134.48]
MSEGRRKERRHLSDSVGALHEHSGKTWFAIDKDMGDPWELIVQEKFIFPYLESLCNEMISKIMQGLLLGSLSLHCNYPEVMNEPDAYRLAHIQVIKLTSPSKASGRQIQLLAILNDDRSQLLESRGQKQSTYVPE